MKSKPIDVKGIRVLIEADNHTIAKERALRKYSMYHYYSLRKVKPGFYEVILLPRKRIC